MVRVPGFPMRGAGRDHEVAVKRIVRIVEESLLTPVSPLGDMMGITRKDDTRLTSHRLMVTRP